jgi:hypothetical protein
MDRELKAEFDSRYQQLAEYLTLRQLAISMGRDDAISWIDELIDVLREDIVSLQRQRDGLFSSEQPTLPF